MRSEVSGLTVGRSTPGRSTPGDSTPGRSTPGDSTPGDSTADRLVVDARPRTGRIRHRNHVIDLRYPLGVKYFIERLFFNSLVSWLLGFHVLATSLAYDGDHSWRLYSAA